MVTLILTLTMCTLLFLMIWAATYFSPWTGLLRFFPRDIEEKARHTVPLPNQKQEIDTRYRSPVLFPNA